MAQVCGYSERVMCAASPPSGYCCKDVSTVGNGCIVNDDPYDVTQDLTSNALLTVRHSDALLIISLTGKECHANAAVMPVKSHSLTGWQLGVGGCMLQLCTAASSINTLCVSLVGNVCLTSQSLLELCGVIQ